jgi:hypothetical protein
MNENGDEIRTERDDCDTDRPQSFTTIKEAFAFVRDYEERTDSRFVTVKSKKSGNYITCVTVNLNMYALA